MESATAEQAPTTDRYHNRLIPCSRPLQATTLITLAWATAMLTIGKASPRGSTTRDFLTGIGIALMTICFIGAVTLMWSRHRLDVRDRYVETDTPGDTRWKNTAAAEPTVESAPIFATLRQATQDETESMGPGLLGSTSVETAERASVAKATLEFLRRQVELDATPQAPVVWLIRVGVVGVEVLLATVCEQPSPGFISEGGGLVWRLKSLDELATLLADDRIGDLENLWELGEDDESTYFAVPDLDDPPYCDQLPHDDVNAHYSSFGAALSLFETSEETILEPFGLHLVRTAASLRTVMSPTDVEIAPDEDFPTATMEIEDTRDEEDLPEAIQQADELNELAAADDLKENLVEVTEPLTERDQLVPPGKVEVRILREEPDLIGDLIGEPSAAAVDLLAYLVLHGHRATTSRLRDSIGMTRTQSSRSGKTVWSAASAARKVLGTELFPGASGNQLYRLSEKVSCDWLRFATLVEIAKQSETNSNRARAALSQALALIDGVPAIASRRFLWLDDEGILREITQEVVSASLLLGEMELEGGSPEVVRWALDKGLALSPSNRQLLDLEKRFAQVAQPL